MLAEGSKERKIWARSEHDRGDVPGGDGDGVLEAGLRLGSSMSTTPSLCSCIFEGVVMMDTLGLCPRKSLSRQSLASR